MAKTESSNDYPWFKFWTADWLGDLNLRQGSPLARAAWIDSICHMERSKTATLEASVREFARLWSFTPDEALEAIRDLDKYGIADVERLPRSVDSPANVRITCRRMVRKYKARQSDRDRKKQARRKRQERGRPADVRQTSGECPGNVRPQMLDVRCQTSEVRVPDDDDLRGCGPDGAGQTPDAAHSQRSESEVREQSAFARLPEAERAGTFEMVREEWNAAAARAGLRQIAQMSEADTRRIAACFDAHVARSAATAPDLTQEQHCRNFQNAVHLVTEKAASLPYFTKAAKDRTPISFPRLFNPAVWIKALEGEYDE